MKKLLVMVTALLNGIIYLSKSPMVELPWAFLFSSLEHKATGYAQQIYFEIGRLFFKSSATCFYRNTESYRQQRFVTEGSLKGF